MVDKLLSDLNNYLIQRYILLLSLSICLGQILPILSECQMGEGEISTDDLCQYKFDRSVINLYLFLLDVHVKMLMVYK